MLNHTKIHPVFYLFIFLFLGACSAENEFTNTSPPAYDGLLFRLQAEEFENNAATRSTGTSVPFDTICFYITDMEGSIVTDCHAMANASTSQIVAEGIKDGNYRLLVLGIKGNPQDDRAIIHKLADSSSAWLSYDEQTPAAPLKAEYYYIDYPFSVTGGRMEEQAITLHKGMGMADFRLEYMSDYVRRSSNDLSFIPSEDSRCYSTLHGDGSYSGSRSIKDFSLREQKQILLFPTVKGRSLKGKVALHTINHRKEKLETKYAIDTDIVASRQSVIEVKAIHPDDNTGLLFYDMNDLTPDNYYTILTDDEPHTIYYDGNERSFHIANPLQVKAVNDSLHLRFYSPLPVKQATIMGKSNTLDEFVELAYFDSIPAFADIRVPATLLKEGTYHTQSGKIYTLSAEDLSLDSLSFKVSSPDVYWSKLSRIKAKWRIKFNPYGADPVTGANNGSWGALRPVHIREAIALFLNIGYMCSLEEFQAWCLTFQGQINDNHGNPVDMLTVIPLLESLSGFDVGLIWSGADVYGLGGQRTWGVQQFSFFMHYDGNNGELIPVFHELGHCMGYGHSSGMTYGKWAGGCANMFYKRNIADFPVNSYKILNSRNNPNRYL